MAALFDLLAILMTAIPKRKPYRNRKLLDLAHEIKTCQFKSPVCIGYQSHGCEPMHSNFQEHGKGGGQKADDDQFCAGCSACHFWFDSGDGKSYETREKLLAMFNEGRERTFNLLRACGLLKKVGYAKT